MDRNPIPDALDGIESRNSARPILEVRDLAVQFNTRTGLIFAVNGMGFELYPGETLGIVGESGSGKSVSMLAILQLLTSPPAQRTGGSAYFEGRDLLTLKDEQIRQIRGAQIGMIFQDPMTYLNPVITVGEQIAEPLILHRGLAKRAARGHTIELLERVGIPEPEKRYDQFPHQLSGGMRQRVMIAMALACNPKVLIADEPTTALDVTIQAQILELVKKLRDEFGMAIIWITHDLGIVAALANHVAVMYAGFIVESAPANELYDHPMHPYTRGLLNSLPRLDVVDRNRLFTINGLPPILSEKPLGCPFAPRCSMIFDACRENPKLRAVGDRHMVACWFSACDGRL